MFKHFITLEWKSFFRSASLGMNIGMKILMGFFSIYLMVLFIGAGVGAFFLIKEKLHLEPLSTINKFMIYYLVIDLLVRYFLQKMPVLNIKPLLTLPIKKDIIVHFTLGKTILSFFNWTHYEGKELVECAFETLWSVRSLSFPQLHEYYEIRYIDLTLIQRSQDYLTTSSINSIQYVMLAMMVANHLTFKTGIRHSVGKFLHIVQNCHIYDKHLDAAKEILEREETGLQPKIKLVCEPKNFYEHTIEDFKFTNLEGIKPLTEKLEIAI